MQDDLTKQILAEISSLEADRQLFDSLWQDLAKVCMPRKQVTRKNNSIPDTTDIEEQLDVTAQQSNQTLAAGQMAHITPMGGAEWFRLEPPHKLANVPAAVRWYSELSVTIARALANSNFYNEAHEHYLDRGAFGIAAMEVTAGPGGMGVHFRSFHIGTYSVAEDEFGKINRIARRYKITAQQAVGFFGPDANLPEPIRKAFDNGTTEKFEFVQYIRPNRDYNPQNLFSKKFESFDLAMGGENHLIRKTGFHDFPCAVSRWQKWGEESPYGWSPALYALPPARQANHLETLGDLLAENAAFPRMLLPSSMKGEIDIRPGGASYYDVAMGAAEMPREWLTQGRYDILEARLDRKKQAIESAFFVQLFELITEKQKSMTAYEVSQLVSEKGALFHPIFVRAVVEFLTPIILRVYSLLARQPGALPTPPQEVIMQGPSGPELPDPEVTYISPLALAITQNQVNGLPNVLQQLALIGQIDPTVYDSVATEEIYPTLARASGLPEKLIRTPEAVANIQQGRAQAQQMAQAEQLAGAAGKLGGAEGIDKLSKMLPEQ
jgi:hypothetical protein